MTTPMLNRGRGWRESEEKMGRNEEKQGEEKRGARLRDTQPHDPRTLDMDGRKIETAQLVESRGVKEGRAGLVKKRTSGYGG